MAAAPVAIDDRNRDRAKFAFLRLQKDPLNRLDDVRGFVVRFEDV